MIINIKALSTQAILPYRATSKAAGYDMSSIENHVISPGESALVGTGIAMQIPDGYYGRLASRSGLAVKHNIEVGAGVIDADYEGEIKILLRNLGRQPCAITAGQRIAQIIITKIAEETRFVEVEDFVTAASSNSRGSCGFGSTGFNFGRPSSPFKRPLSIAPTKGDSKPLFRRVPHICGAYDDFEPVKISELTRGATCSRCQIGLDIGIDLEVVEEAWKCKRKDCGAILHRKCAEAKHYWIPSASQGGAFGSTEGGSLFTRCLMDSTEEDTSKRTSMAFWATIENK
jgi:dUTP pyrophosphatase